MTPYQLSLTLLLLLYRDLRRKDSNVRTLSYVKLASGLEPTNLLLILEINERLNVAFEARPQLMIE